MTDSFNVPNNQDSTSASGLSSRPRRKLLINHDFQMRFIGFAGASALVASLCFYAANCYLFYRLQGYAIDAAYPSTHPFFGFLATLETGMTWVLFGTSIVVLLFSAVAGLVFSSRVAGPLMRLKNHFDRVARGETLSNISFREKDHFDELAASYNRQMEKLRARVTEAEEAAKSHKKAA